MRTRLTSEQMQKTLEQFIALQEILLEELSLGDKAKISNWINSVTLINPVVALRPDNLTQLIADIFDDETITHYVLDLTFRFFSTVNTAPEFIVSLCNNLSDGLCIDGPVTKHSMLPDSIKMSSAVSLMPATSVHTWLLKLLRFVGLTDEVTVVELLRSNTFLMIVFLTHLTNTTTA